MDYVGRIFRPPSEADSLLLQITVGCSHNRCSYCDMYRDKNFRAKPWPLVEADIKKASTSARQHRRIFLCDGDALILSTKKLVPILDAIRTHLPWIERVSSYGDTRSIKGKSVEQLRTLSEKGLTLMYHGVETGDDAVMDRIDKGGTYAECVSTAEKLRAANITHSVMVLLGIGGTDLSEQHATSTAKMLTEMDPRYVGALTTTVVEGTPLWQQQQRGDFALPSKFRMLTELRTIVAESRFSDCRFSANHASNYLPLRANLPEDRDKLVALLDTVIEKQDESWLKPERLRGL